jgi:hypothetical protein
MNIPLSFKRWSTPVQRLLSVRLKVNAVAIHSKTTHFSASLIENWYDHSIGWLRGQQQRSLSLSFIGVQGFKDVDTYAFLDADKKLRNRGFTNLPYVSIYAASPGGMKSLAPKFSSSLSNALTKVGYSYCVCTWEDTGPEDSEQIFLKQCQWAQSWGILDYARALQQSSLISAKTEATAGPSATHLVKTSVGYSRSGHPTNKIFESGGHPIDYLRDIYPLQTLSSVHLSHRMETDTLKEWIESSQEHGVLKPFSDEHWIWEIPNERIGAIRDTLNRCNLLTLYLPDMSRIFEDYGVRR